MSRVFADSSYFVAFLSFSDEHHIVADHYFQEYDGRMLTTQWVLIEVANYFASSAKRLISARFIRELYGDFRFAVLPVLAEDFEHGLRLYEQRPDKEWSLTDCISFNIMRRESLTEVLTADHHFEQAGFEILLKSK